jgi:hypothetical protein
MQVDENLAWEQRKETERDTPWVGSDAATRGPAAGSVLSRRSRSRLSTALQSAGQVHTADFSISMGRVHRAEYTESGQMQPPYVRGQAYLALRQGKQPANECEFLEFIDHRTIIANSRLTCASWTSSRVCPARRQCQGPVYLSGFFCDLERRRCRHPHPEKSQGVAYLPLFTKQELKEV